MPRQLSSRPRGHSTKETKRTDPASQRGRVGVRKKGRPRPHRRTTVDGTARWRGASAQEMWKRRREGARSCKGKACAWAAGPEQEAGRGPCVPPAAAGRRQAWIAGPFAAASASGLCSGKARAQPGLSHSQERAQIALHLLVVLRSRLGSSGISATSPCPRFLPGLGNGKVSNSGSRNRLCAAAERGHPLGTAARPLVAPRSFPNLRVQSRASPRPTPARLACSLPWERTWSL